MFFDASLPPDPQCAEAWCDDETEPEAFELPDTIDRLIEISSVVTMQAAQRLIGVDVLRREFLAAAVAHGRSLTDVVERSVRLEIAAALRVAENEAGVMLALGEALVDRYPAVLDSFAAARMTERHARTLVDALDALEPEFRTQILDPAIELAEELPVGAFRRRLNALAETVRATTLTARHDTALARRRVVLQPDHDAMTWVMALMPAVEAHAIWARATAIAKVLLAQDGEERTLDQLRADVMADLLIEGDTTSHPARARGIRATVAVTVPVLTLLDDASSGSEPALVEGVGPIPIARARELAGASEGWMRVLTHPETGMVLSVGRDRYRPPPALRRLVAWRADRCMAPGCGIPASRCQIDHRLAWEDGGETRLDNLNPLCIGHHTVKHHGGWRVLDVEGGYGAVEWISPTGRRYVVEPERKVPVFRTHGPTGPPPF
ncbi:HNH endonuclease signature motif containing protein [Microbacterium rhizomatis]|uniref:DUF222 domain-containing protein n=1 Tax=Microbacterium rhizomatis TaxID=1631477 RepID=A0A5J5J0H9_9MICO|nr:HNH endonuclease signature motif containing protein [Microbacterium rhizomatis]KAA9108021.1 DUF222 domain-containing protein [Microbacterium rhizomatis]